MGVIRNLDNAKRLVLRVLPDAGAPCERPDFVAPAAAALLASLFFLFAPGWPLFLFFPPTLLLACRYHELARHRTVHRSSWLLLLIAVCVVASAAWSFAHHAGALALVFDLALGTTMLGLGGHLWSTQQQLARGQSRRALDRSDEEGLPRWACGGLLAGMPVLFLLGLLGGLLSWRSPLLLLWGSSGLVLLGLQLRCHRLFPRFAIAWLAALLAIESLGPLAYGDPQGDDLFLAAAILLVIAPLAAYLEFHPRVRRTFHAAPPPRRDHTAPVALEPVAVEARPVRRRGTSIPA